MTRSGVQRKKNLLSTLRLEGRAQPASGSGDEWPDGKDRLQGMAGRRENKIMEGLGGSFQCSRPTMNLSTVTLCLNLCPDG